ncbi:MAG: polymer-forming cytoskeletal protein [Pseudomonadota bacterium]
MAKEKFFSKDADQINGLFDKGCSFEGKLTFDGTVQINGDFQGDILSDGTLIVGTDATVRAKIQVNNLIVEGKVEGIVEAKNKVEIHSHAQFIGDIITPGLVVEEGGILHGGCQMQATGKMTHVTDITMKPKGKKEDYMAEAANDKLI